MIFPRPNETLESYLFRCVPYLTETGENLTSLQANIIGEVDWNSFKNQSQQIIDIKSTYEIINEVVVTAGTALATGAAGSLAHRLITRNKRKSNDKKGDVKNDLGELTAQLIKKDGPSNSNKIFPRPKGIIITDTFNNPFFPISFPRIDTSKFNLPEVSARFHEDYTGMKLDYLPWHFTVEFIKSKYYVFNTRPIDMKFPFSTTEGEKIINRNNVKINDRMQKFIKTKPFNLDEAIHVVIIGDSYKDVYLQRLYEMIGRNCIGPIARYFKISPTLWTKIWALNMGRKFKCSLLEHYLKR